jgi:hypothetical protein
MIVGHRCAARAALILGVLAVASIPLGRWQAQRATAAERQKIERVASMVGPLGARMPTAYRLATYDCLLYSIGRDAYALELCFDRQGRLVEAIDRAHVDRPANVGTLRYDPGRVSIVVAPGRLLALFHRAGALRKLSLIDGLLPGPFVDAGPVPTVAGKKLLKLKP